MGERKTMKNVFDFETAKIEVGGWHPCFGTHTLARMMAALNEAEEEAVDSYLMTTCYPFTKERAIIAIDKVLSGPKPVKGMYVTAIAKAISDAYDALPKPRDIFTAEEEDALIGYLGWLEGGIVVDNEIVPLVKPDEKELLLAGQALEKLFADWY